MKTEFGKYKEVLRDHVRDLVTSNMVIFSLPSYSHDNPHLNFYIEGKAKKAVCCERENEIFLMQLDDKASDNCELNNCLASEAIGRYTYDLIFLDLCGTLSKEFFNCLNNARLKPEGVLIITLLKAREPKKWAHLMDNNKRIESYYGILESYGYYMYKTIEYNDTAPMIVLFANQSGPPDSIDSYKIK